MQTKPDQRKLKPMRAVVSEAEYLAIHEALLRADGNVALAAKLLQMPLTSLWRKIRSHKITPELFKRAVRDLAGASAIVRISPFPIRADLPGGETVWSAQGIGGHSITITLEEPTEKELSVYRSRSQHSPYHTRDLPLKFYKWLQAGGTPKGFVEYIRSTYGGSPEPAEDFVVPAKPR